MGRRLGIMVLAAAFAAGEVHAEDWATLDGQTYHNVKVMSHDDAYVTILDSDGGARILLRTLGPDLQKRFSYDATKAVACEAATIAADKHDRDALKAQQTVAQVQAPAPAPVLVPLAPQPQAVILHGPSAPPKKSAVDVLANNMKIEQDEKDLEDIEIDIRDAERDQQRDIDHYNYHWDDTGTIHPNTIGDSPQDRLKKFQKKKKALEDEISDLKAQNAAAGQPAQ